MCGIITYIFYRLFVFLIIYKTNIHTCLMWSSKALYNMEWLSPCTHNMKSLNNFQSTLLTYTVMGCTFAVCTSIRSPSKCGITDVPSKNFLFITCIILNLPVSSKPKAVNWMPFPLNSKNAHIFIFDEK